MAETKPVATSDTQRKILTTEEAVEKFNNPDPPWPGQEEADAIKLGEHDPDDPMAAKKKREAREKREAKAEEHPAGYKTR